MVCSIFWSNSQGPGIHWRKRDIIHRPRGLGGLEIRNVGALNEALLMLKAWRIQHHPQLLISKVYDLSRTHDHARPHRFSNTSWGFRGVFRAAQNLTQPVCLESW